MVDFKLYCGLIENILYEKIGFMRQVYSYQNLLEKLSDNKNWDYNEIHDKYGDYIGGYKVWNNDYYDPSDIAEELFDKLFTDN